MAKKDGNLSFGWKGEGEAPLLKPVTLTEAADEMEAAVVRSLLASCGIPSRLRSTGIGAFMGIVLGTNRFGIRIEVAEDDLETAQKILSALPQPDESAEAPSAPPSPDGEEPMEETKRESDAAGDSTSARARSRFLLLILLVGLALLVVLVLRIAEIL